jgi:hypothetical protein
VGQDKRWVGEDKATIWPRKACNREDNQAKVTPALENLEDRGLLLYRALSIQLDLHLAKGTIWSTGVCDVRRSNRDCADEDALDSKWGHSTREAGSRLNEYFVP